jgi:hypothetical protein
LATGLPELFLEEIHESIFVRQHSRRVSVVTVTYATGQSKQSEQGTIVQVKKQNVATPSVRANAKANRTPLQSDYSVYTVSVQLNCEIYVGRYETEIDDLPSALRPNNSVPVRLEKSFMYLDFPGYSVKTKIVHHNVRSQGACANTALAR